MVTTSALCLRACRFLYNKIKHNAGLWADDLTAGEPFVGILFKNGHRLPCAVSQAFQ